MVALTAHFHWPACLASQIDPAGQTGPQKLSIKDLFLQAKIKKNTLSKALGD